MDRALGQMRKRSAPRGETPEADGLYLDRAIALAWKGAGKTGTNPLVGAVVVNRGRVVGVGYHPAFGLEHAETAALAAAGPLADGGTLYATLEPCVHHGKTPPCAEAVVAAGIRRVVVCTRDPDPRMNGAGIETLRRRGIEVDVGVRADAAIVLNVGYFKRVLGLGPAVTLKMATSLDGRIASGPGRRDQITGRECRRFVHRLRAVQDGVAIGIETFAVDRPRLDCRLLDDVNVPVPIVLDTNLRIRGQDTRFGARRGFVVATGDDADREKIRAVEKQGGLVVRCERAGGGLDLDSTLRALAARGMKSVLVEGGARVFTSFLRSGVWDAMYVFVSPQLFGPKGVGLADGPIAKSEFNAVLVGAAVLSQDVVLSYLNESARRELRKHLL